MAITGPGSYLSTAAEFMAHWKAAENELGEPIVLRGGVTFADFVARRDVLEARITELIHQINQREYARGSIKAGSEALVGRLDQFNARVRVLFEAGSRFVQSLPKVPSLTSAAEKIITPLEDAANIWAKIEAAGTVMVLSGGYTRAQFNEELDALRQAYQDYKVAASEEKLVRGARNEAQDAIYPLLKQYREVIPTYFAPKSAAVASLPRLTPLPGSTPKPVNASAVWDEPETKARIAFEASDNAHLKEYQVRYTPGPDYDEDDAAVVANIAPDAPPRAAHRRGSHPARRAEFVQSLRHPHHRQRGRLRRDGGRAARRLRPGQSQRTYQAGAQAEAEAVIEGGCAPPAPRGSVPLHPFWPSPRARRRALAVGPRGASCARSGGC